MSKIIEKLGITPSPWDLIEVGNFGKKAVSHNMESLLTIADEDGLSFGCVYCDKDAQLIAQAPSMLEALIEIVDTFTDVGIMTTENNEAIRVIEKATNKQWDEIKELIQKV